MMRRVKSMSSGVVLVFALAIVAALSFWLAPVEHVYADDCPYEEWAIATCGCPITLDGYNYNGGPDYYKNSGQRDAASGVLTAVRKGANRTDKYGKYEKTVWGKPGDDILFANCYFPGIQRMNTAQIATVAHAEHKTELSSSDVNGIPEGGTVWFNNSVVNDSLLKLSQDELNAHKNWKNGRFGGDILDDGPYRWAPNFARVRNLAETEVVAETGEVTNGGMGIDGNITLIGRQDVMSTTNSWTIGEHPWYGENHEYQFSWHVGVYSEKSWIPYETHATLENEEGENHTWPCYYPKTIGGQQCPTPSGFYCAGSNWPTHCSGPVRNGSEQNCRSCGGTPQYTYHYNCTGTQNVPYTCAHPQAWWVFKKDNNVGDKESSATLIIPYNYQLSGEVEINVPYVYAGETLDLKKNGGTASVLVGGRPNSLTGADASKPYATDIPYLKAQLITYAADENKSRISDISEGDVIENKRGNNGLNLTLPSWSPNEFTSVNVHDVDAGKYFCVAIKYYPTSSGSEGNYTDIEGDHTWGISEPACVVVAKKPSVQIWGGSLYSAGNVTTAQMKKNNLSNVYPYDMTDTERTRISVYGSWVDQSIYSVKPVQGLASGATIRNGILGLKTGDDKTVFCNRLVPLSFANKTQQAAVQICPDVQQTGSMKSKSGTGRRATIDKITGNNNTPNVSGNAVNISDSSNYKVLTVDDKEVRYSYKKDNFNLVGGTVNMGVTHVVRSDNTITIIDNIVYQNATYAVADQIPKLIIYAKDIIISCNVDRVDAVLFAEGKIDTCNDPDVNSKERSRQLKINGSIVSNTLDLHRTYGAVTGEQSKIPAEIIDYDTSLILWAAVETAASDSSVMNITYQHELAPRY